MINKRIFSLTSYVGSQMLRLKGANLKESIFGTLFSLLMSLRVNPNIYYSRNITFGHDFSEELAQTMGEQQQEFPKDFNGQETALLIFDREEDFFTPLLLPITYQVFFAQRLRIDRR